jgi:U3 small nucleolar RNA-associated protein 20
VCVAGESFFQEGLTRWRETNLSESFLSLAGKLHPLCATLPLLVLHQRAIVEALITRLVPDASLALEPVCSLAGLLARDLRGDFLPHVKSLVEAFARLLDAGADREPEHMVRATQLASWIDFAPPMD